MIIQGLEVAFGEWVVVRSVWPIMRAGDAEIGEQQGSGFGLHRSATVGMQGELAGGDIMFGDRVIEQGFEQRSAFSIGDAPGDAAAGAETIVGLRPSSLSAPAAARVSAVFDLGHNHWMFVLCPQG